MKIRRLMAMLVFCFVAGAGCSPATVIRCALTDLLTAEPGPQPADTRTVAAAAETVPVLDACDAADDPAVWVNESDPEASLIVATNKLSIYAPSGGDPHDGFLVASSQGNHTYVVYDRAPPHAYRGTFRVGAAGAVDGAQDTDGLHVVSARLGPRYPMGLLVVQDGINLAPDGSQANQNFKLVSWRDVLDALDVAGVP